jgi:hypothetical protein
VNGVVVRNMLLSNNLNNYKQALLSLPVDRGLTKEDLLVDDFLMERSGEIEIYYAPHNEYLNHSAKVVILGITPGWTQMKIAFHAAQKGLKQGLPDEEICKTAKKEAGFAGSLRRNLITFLDELNLHRHLDLRTSEDLFMEQRKLLHTTSLLRYPAFVRKKNYTGGHPKLLSTPYLRESALMFIQEELQWLKQSLIIPLGKTVESVLRILEQEGKLDAGRCLWGFPHPSGANGHRHTQFSSNANRMRMMMDTWFKDRGRN